MKYKEIIQHLKQQILSGALEPGSFLPHRGELIRLFEASNVTVQRAVNQLLADGFLRSCGSKGVMISLMPPHKNRFAVLLPASSWPEKPGYDTKWSAIDTVLNKLNQSAGGMQFVRYHVTRETHLHANEFNVLRDDLNNSLLAGVITTCSLPDGLIKSLDGFPVVQCEARTPKLIRSVQLNHDYIALADLAVKELVNSGAKRIAIIMNSEINPFFSREIEKNLFRQPITIREEWIQAISCTSREQHWIKRLLKLLFMPEMKEKPDGLILLNENFLAPALDALTELRLDIGKDIHVCCHCNLPGKNFAPDIHFAGFDWNSVFQKSIWCLKNFHILDDSYFEKEFLLPPKLVKKLKQTRADQSFILQEKKEA